MMPDSRQRIIDFIERENAFTVLSEFRRQGLLSKEDVNRAMGMSREEWLDAMKKAAGLTDNE